MASGGLLSRVRCQRLHPIHIPYAGIHSRQELRRLKAPERGPSDLQHFPNCRGGGYNYLAAFGQDRAQPYRREGRLDRVRDPLMAPVLVRKLMRCHQPLPLAR
jgi:hypothetical protein